MKIDPVCGMEVVDTTLIKTDSHDQTWYFCSQDCLDEFESDPEEYVGDETL